MPASSNLTLNLGSETNLLAWTDGNVYTFGDRGNVMANTTVIETKFSTHPFSPLSDPAKQFIIKLNSFKLLTSNWDSYGALPPSPATIFQAISFVNRADKNLLPFYFVAPGPNGEVVIEFKRNQREAAVYINPDGSTELILTEGDNYILEGTLDGHYKELLTFING